MKLSALDLYNFSQDIIRVADKVMSKGMGSTYISTDLGVRVWTKRRPSGTVYTVSAKRWKYAVESGFQRCEILSTRGDVSDIEPTAVLAKLMV